MHGAGNDFVLIDLRTRERELDAALVRKLADRKLGVGFDQLLVLRRPRSRGALASYEIWNTDGSMARQCGNGARCIGLFLQINNETPHHEFSLDSPSGVVSMFAAEDGEMEVDMGVPDFSPDKVPTTLASRDGWYYLPNGEDELRLGAVSIGSSHALMVVNDIDSAPVGELGPAISRNEAFPEGCNAGFAEIVDRNRIRLRVYERGVGETLACGSGACAAMVWLCQAGLVDENVDVILPGGHLVIKWVRANRRLKDTDNLTTTRTKADRNVIMKGPARYVFKGEINE